MKRLAVAILVSLVISCAAEITEEGADTTDTAGASVVGTRAFDFAGSLSASGTSWVTHTFEVAAAGPISATLNWSSTAADLNLFLYNPSGTLVAYANTTTAKPEVVGWNATVTGNWRVGIKCKTGSSSYTLHVTAPSAPDFPGQAPPGMLVWGAAISGNGDPVARHEAIAGHPLRVRRTFFQWTSRTTSMITIARDDIAHHRLPWVSVKTPSWADMAAGRYDSQIDEMLRALDALPGPVWLTVHHEPEGGGGVNHPDDPAGPAGHVGMNRRVRQRMTALGVDNVALAPILMSWTWTSASGRNPDQWWADGIYDFLGVDHYKDSQATLLDTQWFSVRTWAAARHVNVAVGEWGMRGTDTAAGNRVREWYDHAANSNADGRGARVIGLSAFDSNLNSPTGGWELQGEQLRVFRLLLGDPRTADVVGN